MRLIGTFARIGMIILLGTLLAVVMDTSNWGSGNDTVLTTADFAVSMLVDWAFALVALGALLAMAMAGAAYLVRDEREVNLMWELTGGEEE
ncbi:MAG: hypothetical protein QF440_03300 [Candidatus Thalassarchaeaceae archaeon]|jgi:hypothetical protein|nr:hypothetical protein [Candidatus Thalassarchaeaceae archaeon]